MLLIGFAKHHCQSGLLPLPELLQYLPDHPAQAKFLPIGPVRGRPAPKEQFRQVCSDARGMT